MTEPLFSWVHLSDIHVGHGGAEHQWDQRIVLDAIRDDLATLADRPSIDAILVTGDVAFSGAGRSKDEYERAATWLDGVAKAVGVDRSKIYIVPGNHDVNRGADKDPVVADVMERLRGQGTPIDAILGKTDDRAALAKRMEAYLDFSAQFGPWPQRALLPVATDRLYWSHVIPAKGGLSVRVVGLNTAMLARDDLDKGQLMVGKEQIAKTLSSTLIPDGEVVMVLTHHPIKTGWLRDEADIKNLVLSRSHIHLSGHVHEAESALVMAGTGGQHINVVAGASHGEKLPPDVPAQHGYNIGSIVAGKGGLDLRVRPRVWSHRETKFRADSTSVPEGHIFAEHRIRALAPGQTILRAPADQPYNVFISYAREDEPLLKELEKHLSGLKRNKLINAWSTARIGAGEAWTEERDKHLREADVVLILVSPDYVASDECYDVELTRAAEAHARKEILMVPIYLRSCDIPDGVPFIGLMGQPQNVYYAIRDKKLNEAKFIMDLPSRDQAFKDVAIALRSMIEADKKKKKSP